MTDKYNFEIITKQLEVGTRIHWDSKKECLYFVDIPTSNFYKYVPQTEKLFSVKIGDEALAFSFPVSDAENTFIAGLGRKFITFRCNFDDGTISDIKVIAEVDSEGELRKNRLNGAKIDPYGALWAGTMGPEVNGQVVPGRGSLYSVKKGVVKKHEDNIGISNGLAWNQKENKMYYIDTLSPDIFVYDYDHVGPNITNKRSLFNIKASNIQGLPDGLIIDSKTNLWVTMIFGSCILQIDSTTGSLLQRIIIPTSQPTSLTFGNQNLRTLYITTAKIPVNGKEPDHPAGCTYSVENVDTPGVEDFSYRSL